MYAAAPEVAVRPGIGDRLSKLIQLPTVSADVKALGADGPRAVRDFIAAEYPQIAQALELERIGDLGLLYRWRGQTGADPLVLMAHYDVVPVDPDQWTRAPFGGEIDGGIVYGRGALDDKGPLIVILEAVENLLAAGFTPARDVYLSFGGDEETDGTAAQAIVAHFTQRGIRPALVVDEGGAVVDAPLPFVTGEAAMVGLGEKGLMMVRLRTESAGGHASAPPRTTATGRLARALTRLEPNPFPKQAQTTLLEMLRAFLPHTSIVNRAVLKALIGAPAVTAQVMARMGGEPAAMVQTTVAATMLEAGQAMNVLAPSAEAILNLRLATGDTVQATLERLRAAIDDDEVQIELLQGSDPSPQSPAGGPGFAAIRDAIAAAYPDAVTAPYLMMQATDSRFIHRYVPHVYRFAPLRMSAAQRATIHAGDENVEIDSLRRGEVFHRTLISGYAAANSTATAP